VPPGVRRAGSDRHDIAGSRGPLLAADPEAGRAREDLEALHLMGMEMCRDEPSGREHVLDAKELSVRLLRGGEEDEALSRDRVLDRLAGSRHVQVIPDWRSPDSHKCAPGPMEGARGVTPSIRAS